MDNQYKIVFKNKTVITTTMNDSEIASLTRALTAGPIGNYSYQEIDKYHTTICLPEVQYIIRKKEGKT